MRNVACGTAIYRVYPFCLLQVGESDAFQIVHGAIGASETNLRGRGASAKPPARTERTDRIALLRLLLRADDRTSREQWKRGEAEADGAVSAADDHPSVRRSLQLPHF